MSFSRFVGRTYHYDGLYLLKSSEGRFGVEGPKTPRYLGDGEADKTTPRATIRLVEGRELVAVGITEQRVSTYVNDEEQLVNYLVRSFLRTFVSVAYYPATGQNMLVDSRIVEEDPEAWTLHAGESIDALEAADGLKLDKLPSVVSLQTIQSLVKTRNGARAES